MGKSRGERCPLFFSFNRGGGKRGQKKKLFQEGGKERRGRSFFFGVTRGRLRKNSSRSTMREKKERESPYKRRFLEKREGPEHSEAAMGGTVLSIFRR